MAVFIRAKRRLSQMDYAWQIRLKIAHEPDDDLLELGLAF
jgi:hypothetical protein